MDSDEDYDVRAFRRRKAFARWTGLSLSTIDRAVAKGELAKIKVGRATLISTASAHKWLGGRSDPQDH
jgi:excisionase family DNA binding protein